MTPTNGHLMTPTSIVFKEGIRLLFEINLVDLRTDPLKKEGMMVEPSVVRIYSLKREGGG